MEHKQLLLQPTPVSQMGSDCSDFEFPTVISSSQSPNDIVFCRKVISRKTQPVVKYKKSSFQLRSESSSSGSASIGENRCRRSDSNNSSTKHRNGLFGMVKFPLQMELSDMKMRQERRKLLLPPPLPKSGAKDDGGESCWDMVRPLRGRSRLMNALAKATFGCIPIV